VHVVGLDRVMHEPESPALAGFTPRSLQLPHQLRRAKLANVSSDLQGDVTRMPRRQRRPPPMRIAPALARLPPGSGSRATPTRRRFELETELARLHCHRSQLSHIAVSDPVTRVERSRRALTT
jgi:hypothetical protein